MVASDGSPTSHLQRRQPGMASGGMGDALTGVIAGLMAQGMGCATRPTGVCPHAAAGDVAAGLDGERGMLAGDLINCLRGLVNPR